MRLLRIHDNSDFSLVQYVGASIPKYAILSHTWGPDHEEVSFRDLTEGTGKEKTGYRKLVFCANQAIKDGFRHFWVDTCSIDKSSSSELSEAINSMFRWYQEAAICYAYLSDVGSLHDCDDVNSSGDDVDEYLCLQLEESRWFTRGWTLQELLAPEEVVFYDYDWKRLETKKELAAIISHITSIGSFYLTQKLALHSEYGTPPIGRRFSWLARRHTTRPEDMAYWMLGIFDINMPLLYGEGGQKAFIRLQEEIVKVSTDHTIFCWSWPQSLPNLLWVPCFARDPVAFKDAGKYVPTGPSRKRSRPEYSVTDAGLQIDLPLICNSDFRCFAVLNAAHLRDFF